MLYNTPKDIYIYTYKRKIDEEHIDGLHIFDDLGICSKACGSISWSNMGDTWSKKFTTHSYAHQWTPMGINAHLCTSMHIKKHFCMLYMFNQF